jgi:hypothetical protein
MTLVTRLCLGVPTIYATGLGKQKLTKPSAQSMFNPMGKTSLNGLNIVVSTLWNPPLVLAVLLLYGNLGRRARR